jgi:ribonuclease Z
MTAFGVSASQITKILITHFHGDHCLGLAGVLQRISLDWQDRRDGTGLRDRAVEVFFPASGLEYFERMRHASVYLETAHIVPRPFTGPGIVHADGRLSITALPLEHVDETCGYRVKEPDGVTMLGDRLDAAGIAGPDAGRLQREGSLVLHGREHRLEEYSLPRPGQAFALVMDTRPCPAVAELARDADLAVFESTFLDADRDLAWEYRHLTALQAGRLAREAGVRRLVLTHFSQRYGDVAPFRAEAGEHHPDVVAAEDGMWIDVPRRIRPSAQP